MSSSESYHQNRTRVFEIYGLDPKDSQYNCHHIVTRKDFKTGIVDPAFKIDELSNLYPIRVCLHKILNEIIEASDNNQDIQPLLDLWKQTEDNLKQPQIKKIKTKKVSKNTSTIVFPTGLSIRADATNFCEKLSKMDLDKLLSYRNRFKDTQNEKIQDFFQSCGETA